MMDIDAREGAGSDMLPRPNSNFSRVRRIGSTMTRQNSSTSSDTDATPTIILTVSGEEEGDEAQLPQPQETRRPALQQIQQPHRDRPRSARPTSLDVTSPPSSRHMYTYSSSNQNGNRHSLRVHEPRSATPSSGTDGLYPHTSSTSNSSRFTSSSTRYMHRSGMDSLDIFIPRQSSASSSSSPYQNKVVCEIRCRHCKVVCCRRGMRAILLADTNV